MLLEVAMLAPFLQSRCSIGCCLFQRSFGFGSRAGPVNDFLEVRQSLFPLTARCAQSVLMCAQPYAVLVIIGLPDLVVEREWPALAQTFQ
jgi:hypothetical protein